MSIRIIAGRCRGRSLRTPRGDALRPTPGVVRERLFNWLAAEISGAVVLDLFAGSGALGLEAWSRGAARVDFVEKSPQHRQILSENLTLCGLDPRTRLIGHDALQTLSTSLPCYDLILADPPFAQGWPQRLLPVLLAQPGPFRPGAWLYLEASATEIWSAADLPAKWQIHRQGHCGDSHYLLLQQRSSA